MLKIPFNNFTLVIRKLSRLKTFAPRLVGIWGLPKKGDENEMYIYFTTSPVQVKLKHIIPCYHYKINSTRGKPFQGIRNCVLTYIQYFTYIPVRLSTVYSNKNLGS